MMGVSLGVLSAIRIRVVRVGDLPEVALNNPEPLPFCLQFGLPLFELLIIADLLPPLPVNETFQAVNLFARLGNSIVC